MFGKLTRETFEWHPDRLVCKRFNSPDPYPRSGVVGVVASAEASREINKLAAKIAGINRMMMSLGGFQLEGRIRINAICAMLLR